MNSTEKENIKKNHKPIKSFVRHHGRITMGQQFALDNYWKNFGIDFTNKKLSFSEFGDFKKIILEIGFGNGESLIEMAQNNPETLFIGAEVHKPGIGRALILAHEKELNNIKIIEHDAVEFIDEMIVDNSIDSVQIFFPDPWHKKRHFKRRLIQKSFCLKIHRILKPNSILHIATDWAPYAEHCLEVINNIDSFENKSKEKNYIKKPDYRPQTKFERRGIKLGHSVKDMHFLAIK